MKPSEMAQVLGRRGGRVRAARLSADRRAEIASLGGVARARSLQAARRIAENFRYAAAAAELRGATVRVRRQRSFSGVLPGIYVSKRAGSSQGDGLPRRGR